MVIKKSLEAGLMLLSFFVIVITGSLLTPIAAHYTIAAVSLCVTAFVLVIATWLPPQKLLPWALFSLTASALAFPFVRHWTSANPTSSAAWVYSISTALLTVPIQVATTGTHLWIRGLLYWSALVVALGLARAFDPFMIASMAVSYAHVMVKWSSVQ